MHLFRRGARTATAGSRGVKGTRPTQESAESARSIATLAAARVAKTRQQHAAHNDYPGWFASIVLLGGSHPVVFAALVGVACAILALACLPAPCPEWVVIPFPDLPDDYTHAAFFGAIWSVQATLIALVYPIVLTFVPILLQRRASSKFALAFYMRESAVLPAGTSSLLLLLMLSAQYLASYYVPHDFFLFGAVFDGLWLLANIGMTGYFLVKTVRYVEEDVGEETYRRLSLGCILWSDLEEAETAALYDAGAPNIGEYRSGKLEPLVRTMAIQSGEPILSKRLSGRNELVDVDLLRVNRVARSWAKRAESHVVEPAAQRRPPILELLPSFWGEYNDQVHIARISNGPELTRQERRDLLRAYIFKSPRSRLFKGNTKGLLEELGSEVQSQLEQGRFDEATRGLKKLRSLHEAFLRSSNTDQQTNIASSPAPWSLGRRSVGDHWLDPYRSIFEAAANKISGNQSLWRELCKLPAELVRRASPQDMPMRYDLLEQYELLDHFLGTWWTREAHRSQATFAASGVVLPEPTASDYRDAITSVVNGLNVDAVPYDNKGADDEHRWTERLNATVTWMTHADMCARLLIQAVRRGDRVASEWYCDCLSHWLTDRAFEYGSHEFAYGAGLPAVDIAVLSTAWPEAREQISAALRSEANLDAAIRVLWANLQRHWEFVRFTTALLLLRDEVHGTFKELAHSVVGHALTPTFFQPGPSVEGESLLDADLLLAAYLNLCCLSPHARARASSLITRILRTGKDGPTIYGWSYTGHGYATNPESLAKQFMALLLASMNAGRLMLVDATALCRGTQELNTVRALLHLLSLLDAEAAHRPVRGDLQRAAAALRSSFGLLARQMSPLLTWRRKLKQLQQTLNGKVDAELRKVVVPPDAVRTLVDRLQAELLSPTDGKAWNGRMRTAAGVLTASSKTWSNGWHRYEKSAFGEAIEEVFPPAQFQSWARQIAWSTLPLAVTEALEIKAIKPINGTSGGELLLNLAAAIRADRWAGGTPVVLVPRSTVGHVVDAVHWQVSGRSGPPHGVEFGNRPDAEGPFAKRTINGAFVFDMQTPNDRIYLVPLSWFDRLTFERRADGTVLQHDFEVREPDTALLRLHWRAEISGAFGAA